MHSTSTRSANNDGGVSDADEDFASELESSDSEYGGGSDVDFESTRDTDNAQREHRPSMLNEIDSWVAHNKFHRARPSSGPAVSVLLVNVEFRASLPSLILELRYFVPPSWICCSVPLLVEQMCCCFYLIVVIGEISRLE